jgi:GTPase
MRSRLNSDQFCLTSRALQVRTFLNLLPASEGDAERFDSTQPLEVYLFALANRVQFLDPLLTKNEIK